MSRYHHYDEDRASWWRWFIAAMLLTVIACAWGATRIIKSIQLDIVCTGHLKRAADANTIDLAKQELRIAVDYLEKNRDFDIFHAAKMELRKVAFEDDTPPVERNQHVSFWSDLEQGVGTGIVMIRE